MTDEHQVIPLGKASADSESPSYESLAALRGAHSALRHSTSKSTYQPGSKSREQQIRSFLTGAHKAGAFITDAKERTVAQSILDFWSAELASSSKAQSDDFESPLLAPYNATQTRVESDESGAASSKDDQHALIRLSALARQWRNSDKRRGYLLSDEAIEDAAHFKNRDPNLDAFIKASVDAENAKKRRKRNIQHVVVTASTVLACVAFFFLWQFYTLPHTSQSWIRAIKETTSGETQADDLWWLAIVQPWTPPYDLSGTQKFANIWYPGLKLNAPNFSKREFTNVKLPKAHLSSASFSGSWIHIDTKNGNPDGNSSKWFNFARWIRIHTANGRPDWNSFTWNDFSDAELKLTQYGGARIEATSFAGADLYRAVFDRALLCDVNFSNADLQDASFWGATLDDRTYGWLRKTAWWVAVGWNSGDFKKLLNPQSQPDLKTQSVGYSPASTAEARAIRQALRSSDRFHTDIEIPLAETGPSTFDRAIALNDMAWTMATWGIDGESSKKNPAPCNTKADQNDALDAASEAICIIEDLKRKGSQDKDYDYWLSNFRDTQAYILMQADRMPEAKALYEKDIEQTQKSGGMLFRYALTLSALGDKSEADKRFDAAIHGEHYLPRDELQNLKRYIPLSILHMAYEMMDKASPVPEVVQSCSPEAKAN